MSYPMFNVKQHEEGYTRISIINDFVQCFSLTDFIVVAGSGLMSGTSASLLESAGCKNILGVSILSGSSKVNRH